MFVEEVACFPLGRMVRGHGIVFFATFSRISGMLRQMKRPMWPLSHATVPLPVGRRYTGIVVQLSDKLREESVGSVSTGSIFASNTLEENSRKGAPNTSTPP